MLTRSYREVSELLNVDSHRTIAWQLHAATLNKGARELHQPAAFPEHGGVKPLPGVSGTRFDQCPLWSKVL
jgi:hypothetical protein